MLWTKDAPKACGRYWFKDRFSQTEIIKIVESPMRPGTAGYSIYRLGDSAGFGVYHIEDYRADYDPQWGDTPINEPETLF